MSWRYPCVEDPLSPCPYRYKIVGAGITEVVSNTILQCCMGKRQLAALKRRRDKLFLNTQEQSK